MGNSNCHHNAGKLSDAQTANDHYNVKVMQPKEQKGCYHAREWVTPACNAIESGSRGKGAWTLNEMNGSLKWGNDCYAGRISIPRGAEVGLFHLSGGWGGFHGGNHPNRGTHQGPLSNYSYWNNGNDRVCGYQFNSKSNYNCESKVGAPAKNAECCYSDKDALNQKCDQNKFNPLNGQPGNFQKPTVWYEPDSAVPGGAPFKRNITCRDVMTQYCQNLSNFSKPSCQKFVASESNHSNHMDNAIISWCQHHPTDSKCKCINAITNDKVIEKVTEEMGQGSSVSGNLACYYVPCKFPDNYRTFAANNLISGKTKCPGNVNCTIKDVSIKAGNVGAVNMSQGCKPPPPPAAPPAAPAATPAAPTNDPKHDSSSQHSKSHSGTNHHLSIFNIEEDINDLEAWFKRVF